MWSNSTNTQTHTEQMRGKSASTYLCSCRRTLFSHHTLSEFHCSLSHHCHLRSPSLHHSATAQERSSRQDCTEIPSHCTFQEREFLRKIRITLRNLLMWVFFFPIPSLHWLRILFLPQAKIRVPRYKSLSHPITHHSNTNFRQIFLILFTSFTLPPPHAQYQFSFPFFTCQIGRSLEV